MPLRLLRDGILTSDRVDQLSPPAEVFYRRLHSVVDDYGRFDGRASIMLTSTFPLRIDPKHPNHVTVDNIARWLAECCNAGLVRAYQVAGKPYIEVADFKQQVRAKASKYPNPPPVGCNAEQMLSSGAAVAKQPIAVAHLDVNGDGDVNGDDKPPPANAGGPPSLEMPKAKGKPAAKKKAEPQPTPLNPNFAISDAVAKWAKGKGYDKLPEHLEAFIDQCKAKSYSYIDWDAAFRKAIREDWAKLRRGVNGAPPPEKQPTMPWHENGVTLEARGAELGLPWEPHVWYGKYGIPDGRTEYRDAVITKHEAVIRGERSA